MLIQSHCLRLIIIPLCLEGFVYSLWSFWFWTIYTSHAAVFSIISACVFLYLSLFYLHTCVSASLGIFEERKWIELNFWKLSNLWNSKALCGESEALDGFRMIFFSLSSLLFHCQTPPECQVTLRSRSSETLRGTWQPLLQQTQQTLVRWSVEYSGKLLINYSSVIHDLQGYELNTRGYRPIL